MDVSRILTTDWKMFVREIDVPDTEIEAVVEKHRFEPLEQRYQCLCYWLNDKGDQASFKQLIDAAKKSRQVKLAKDIEAISKRGMSGMWLMYSNSYVTTSCMLNVKQLPCILIFVHYAS